MTDIKSGQQIRVADITFEDGTLTARIIGPVVEQNRGAAIIERVNQAIAEAGDGLRCLVLDLEEVTFVTSSGVGAIVRIHNGLGDRGVRTVAYRPCPDVADVLSKMKIDKLYAVARTEAQLKEALAGD